MCHLCRTLGDEALAQAREGMQRNPAQLRCPTTPVEQEIAVCYHSYVVIMATREEDQLARALWHVSSVAHLGKYLHLLETMDPIESGRMVVEPDGTRSRVVGTVGPFFLSVNADYHCVLGLSPTLNGLIPWLDTNAIGALVNRYVASRPYNSLVWDQSSGYIWLARQVTDGLARQLKLRGKNRFASICARHSSDPVSVERAFAKAVAESLGYRAAPQPAAPEAPEPAAPEALEPAALEQAPEPAKPAPGLIIHSNLAVPRGPRELPASLADVLAQCTELHAHILQIQARQDQVPQKRWSEPPQLNGKRLRVG